MRRRSGGEPRSADRKAFEYSPGRSEFHGPRFEEEILEEPDFGGWGRRGYSDGGIPFSRMMEHKRFTGAHSSETAITRKHAGEWGPGQERYDPVKDEKTKRSTSSI
ncbi:MAG: hypothetical protein HDT14_05785 [Oscillibacter sp.]|nr:hypothetical protein [Oscillibacter sp.]